MPSIKISSLPILVSILGMLLAGCSGALPASANPADTASIAASSQTLTVVGHSHQAGKPVTDGNQINGVNYQFTNQPTEEAAYQDALADAKKQADALAGSIGATITGVQSVDASISSANVPNYGNVFAPVQVKVVYTLKK